MNVLYRNRDRAAQSAQHMFGKCGHCHVEVEALPTEVMPSPESNGTSVVKCPDCAGLITVKPLGRLDEAQRAHYLKRLGVPEVQTPGGAGERRGTEAPPTLPTLRQPTLEGA